MIMKFISSVIVISIIILISVFLFIFSVWSRSLLHIVLIFQHGLKNYVFRFMDALNVDLRQKIHAIIQSKHFCLLTF